jgi:hypothetical protein
MPGLSRPRGFLENNRPVVYVERRSAINHAHQEGRAMEYLVTMTTHVPGGTPDEEVADARAREEILAGQVAEAVLEWVKVVEEPVFLTVGVRSSSDPNRLIVRRAAIAVIFALGVRAPGRRLEILTGRSRGQPSDWTVPAVGVTAPGWIWECPASMPRSCFGIVSTGSMRSNEIMRLPGVWPGVRRSSLLTAVRVHCCTSVLYGLSH